MPKLKFTDRTIDNLKRSKARVTYWDASLPAFGVRVGANRKAFIVIQNGGRRHKLGLYPHLSLAEARKKAVEHLYGAAKKTIAVALTDAIDRYLTLRQAELSPGTFREYRRLLGAFKELAGALEDATQARILDHLDSIEGQSDKAHAARAIKTFLNWCVEREYIAANPMLNMKMPKEPSARERVLSDDELAAIWSALDGFTSDSQARYAGCLRLLILTGQRLNQIASLQADWIDYKAKTITFPADIMKSKKEHTIPFGNVTEFYLRQHDMSSRYLTWSKHTRLLRTEITAPHWTLHDFRRTWATNAARLGVSPSTSERYLAHAQPEGKIAAIYNRHRYLSEMREAARIMEKHILDLVTPDAPPHIT